MARKRWPKTAKSIIVPIYSGEVHFVTDPNIYAECTDYLCSDPIPPAMVSGICRQLIDADGRACYVVGVFNGSMTTLVHEIGHLTFCILDHAGVPNEPDSGCEAYCYLLGYLYETFEGVIQK